MEKLLIDSIILARAVRRKTSIVSRDRDFVEIASLFVPSLTTEQNIARVTRLNAE
jgi:hypothetical protein